MSCTWLCAQEHGSSLGLSIAALVAELGRTQKERAEGERYRRELLPNPNPNPNPDPTSYSNLTVASILT